MDDQLNFLLEERSNLIKKTLDKTLSIKARMELENQIEHISNKIKDVQRKAKKAARSRHFPGLYLATALVFLPYVYMTSKEIGEITGLSHRTVERYIEFLIKTLNVSNKVRLAIKAQAEGLICQDTFDYYCLKKIS